VCREGSAPSPTTAARLFQFLKQQLHHISIVHWRGIVMTDLWALQRTNAQRWTRARPTRNFAAVARRLILPGAKSRYQAVSFKTGVPWPVIAVIHERECSQDWTRSLAQGDRWDRVSVHVPSGRGPFRCWEDAAVDALNNCAPYAARNKDWSIGSLLTKLEEYNGLGYAARGVPSPYVWAGTDQYRSGKYVRDGVYDPNVIDGQAGCAGLLMAMKALDASIVFASDAGVRTDADAAAASAGKAVSTGTSKAASNKTSAFASVGAFIESVLLALFAVFKPKGK
jgi:lysozyme family protein